MGDAFGISVSIPENIEILGVAFVKRYRLKRKSLASTIAGEKPDSKSVAKALRAGEWPRDVRDAQSRGRADLRGSADFALATCGRGF